MGAPPRRWGSNHAGSASRGSRPRQLRPPARGPHRDSSLVSVWCTKQHDDQSFVQIEAASEVSPPSEVLVVRTTASSESPAYKDQIKAAVAGVGMLPDGPVRLELAFVIGNRGWLGLWKPTIDALDPIL